MTRGSLALPFLLSTFAALFASTAESPDKAAARLFFEQVLGNNGTVEDYDRLHAPDFVAHGRAHEYSLAEDRQAMLDERRAAPEGTPPRWFGPHGATLSLRCPQPRRCAASRAPRSLASICRTHRRTNRQ